MWEVFPHGFMLTEQVSRENREVQSLIEHRYTQQTDAKSQPKSQLGGSPSPGTSPAPGHLRQSCG